MLAKAERRALKLLLDHYRDHCDLDCDRTEADEVIKELETLWTRQDFTMAEMNDQLQSMAEPATLSDGGLDGNDEG